MFTENPVVKEGIKFYYKILKQNLNQGENLIKQNLKTEKPLRLETFNFQQNEVQNS